MVRRIQADVLKVNVRHGNRTPIYFESIIPSTSITPLDTDFVTAADVASHYIIGTTGRCASAQLRI
jgi:hypothetical protein